MSTIALVDDDHNILTSLSIALEAERYQVTTYSDGLSALEGFMASPPDLAIVDIKMPRMDGMELLRCLREKSDMPVIFLTAKDEEIDELCGFMLGADDFIRKPFSRRVLIERIKVLLRRTVSEAGLSSGGSPTHWSGGICTWMQSVWLVAGKAIRLSSPSRNSLSCKHSRFDLVQSRAGMRSRT